MSRTQGAKDKKKRKVYSNGIVKNELFEKWKKFNDSKNNDKGDNHGPYTWASKN